MVAATLGLDDFPWGPQAEGPCLHLTGEHWLCNTSWPGPAGLRWRGQGCCVHLGWGSRVHACLMCHAVRCSHFNYGLNETGEKSLIGYLASATRQSLQTCQEGKETRQRAEQLNVAGKAAVTQQPRLTAVCGEGGGAGMGSHRDQREVTWDKTRSLGMWLSSGVLCEPWHLQNKTSQQNKTKAARAPSPKCLEPREGQGGGESSRGRRESTPWEQDSGRNQEAGVKL